MHALENRLFGKSILVTDQDSWTDEQIVAAYRGQSAIESAFKTMKDPHFVGWNPMFHWTDWNIRVHALYCVLALSLSSLLCRELHRHGIETSIAELIEALGRIQEVAHIYPPERGLKDHLTLTEMNQTEKRLFEVLELY